MERLNFCSQAKDGLKEFAQICRARGWPDAERAVIATGLLLDEAVKFILPQGGNLFEVGEYQQKDLDLFKLPYPVVAAEFLASKDNFHDSPYYAFPYPRRIALAFRTDVFGGARILADPRTLDGREGTFVLPLNGAADGNWYPNWCLSFWPDDNLIQKIDSKTRAFVQQTVSKHGLIAAKNFIFKKLFLFGEYGAHAMNLGAKNGTDMGMAASRDLGDEEVAIVQLCGALNCANVKTEDVPAPAKLNAKRAKAGKPPLFSYKVLKVETPITYTKGQPQGGTHASPRVHLRRGHIRRLPDRMVWVQPCVVGDKSRGMVVKDYAVSA